MGPVYDDRKPEDERNAMKEPLVDIATEPPQSGGQEPAARSRRRCLSDMKGKADESQSRVEAKPGRPRLGGVLQAEPDEAEVEPQVELPPDGLVDLDVVPTGQERPGRQCMTQMETAPEEGEPQSGSRRTLLAVAEPQVDPATPPNRGHRPRLCQNGTIAEPQESEQPQSQMDPAKFKQLVAGLRAKQNITLAAAGGLLAALIGALVWAMITAATKYQIGWMAVAVGFLVGGTVRVLGRGLDKSFGYLGAGLSVFGCLLGNFMTNCMLIAQTTDLSMTAVLMHICKDLVAVSGLMIANFHPMDVVFYGIAVYEGYRLSFRRLTATEVGSVTNRG